MSKFLAGKALEEKLTDIIWNAKKYILIISPFIKLDNHVRSIFDKIKATHEIYLILVFGKNEDSKHKSLREDDFEYFKEFKNISILYNKDLHGKHYCNEKEGLITSLNLYDYSMINNIEFGVHFSKNINPIEKLFQETEEFTDELVFGNSHLVFFKKPLYKKKLLGLTKSYQSSIIHFDISSDFFRGNKYQIKHLDDFDYSSFSDVDKTFDEKPQRQNNNRKYGFCIRTGEEIPFNPNKPMSYNAYRTWQQFENYDYEENYCHKTGKRSYGKTSMRNPIL